MSSREGTEWRRTFGGKGKKKVRRKRGRYGIKGNIRKIMPVKKSDTGEGRKGGGEGIEHRLNLSF